MNINDNIRQILSENRNSKPSTITVYHGTHNDKENKISKEGLKSSPSMGYDNSGWYMVSTDLSSALFHATPKNKSNAIVFEFEIPVTNENWEGYPYFWPPYDRGVNSKWFALKRPIPAKFIKKIHKISYDDYIIQKNNGLSEGVGFVNNNDIEYRIENIGSHHGQEDLELGLYVDDEIIGMVQFTLYNQELTVSHIIVRSEFRRQGFGFKMMQYIKKMYPEYEYKPSMMTNLGTKFVHKNIDEVRKIVRDILSKEIIK